MASSNLKIDLEVKTGIADEPERRTHTVEMPVVNVIKVVTT